MVDQRPQAIRSARLTDAAAVAGLLGELGYPTSEHDARSRLERALGRSQGGVLVAVKLGDAVAFAAYEFVLMLHRGVPYCRLTTLVVRSDQRRRGLAGALVKEVESTAVRNGCVRLEVTTQRDRDEALAFYAAVGFSDRPHRLIKEL